MTAVEGIDKALRTIFQEAQHSTASHRKLIHALRALHLEQAKGGAPYEEDFFMAILHCVNVLLSVKRNEEVVSRSVRFLVGFVVCSAERDEAAVLGGTTATTRFVENLMLYALNGVDSRDRLVRLRLSQLIVACVNAIDELSDHVWRAFRSKMAERLFDKEAAVRVQAVQSMARLQGLPLTEDGSEGVFVMDVFLDLLAHDPSPDVRRSVLSYIDVSEGSLESILMRRRDVDPSVRKLLYAQKLSTIDLRMMSIQQRDEILRSGLRDRDFSVRKVCIELLFGHWIRSTENNLIQLLFSLDVIRNTSVAESALRAFYGLVPEMFAELSPAFFENLTPETAIALRVYCQLQDREKTADLLPELSTMAGHARRFYEALLAVGSEEESRAELEFIMGELFTITDLMDASDEMGRRVVQELLVDVLGNLEVGEGVFGKALELLTKQSSDIMAFLYTTGQLVADLHELYSGPEAPNSSTVVDEELQKSLESLCIVEADKTGRLTEDVKIMAHLRCLEIVAAALRFSGTCIQRHPPVLELLNDIIIPAINSAYAAVQSAGVVCLGLACTINQDLAHEYIDLLVEFFRLGQDETRQTALKVIFDLILVFGTPTAEKLASALPHLLPALYDPDQGLEAVAAEGYAKLFLHRILADVQVLVGLFQLYFHPATATNTRLRQTLAYFLQAFAYSSAANQSMIASAVLPVLEAWLPTAESSNLTALQVASQLLELCDPTNLVENAERQGGLHGHAELAEKFAWAALKHVHDHRGKLYCQLLGRLCVDSSWSNRTHKRLLFVVGQLIRVVSDKSTLTSLKKLVALLVELDDPTVLLEPEDLIDLRAKLAECGGKDQLRAAATTSAVKSKTGYVGKASKSSALAAVNVMEDITDLLDN